MNRVIIIAEAGVNHNGSITRAKELIDKAAEAKADYVKFQTFSAKTLVSKSANLADYQKKNVKDSSQYEMLKRLELSHEDHFVLKSYAKLKGISFLSTGFDEDSIDFLVHLGIEFIKIPSGELTNYPYLKHIAIKGLPVVMSTGMAELLEVKDTIELLVKSGMKKSDITVLHCNTDYPTAYGDVNLMAMTYLKNELNTSVGYSDHTLGIEVPIAAVALGARVIEKHFTLDRNLPGPDHKASLEPTELAEMVASIRNIEDALSGTGKKTPTASELMNKSIARKSIHASFGLKKGHRLIEGDLTTLRPGDGINPMMWEKVIGKNLKRSIEALEKLNWEDLD
jgi:N,N'-diacetyllegionaminate synthase